MVHLRRLFSPLLLSRRHMASVIERKGGTDNNVGRGTSGAPMFFNRAHKQMQRDAAARRPDREDFKKLRWEIAERLVDRLQDTRLRFPVAVDLGCGDGAVLGNLSGQGGIKVLYQCDSSPGMLSLCPSGNIGDIQAFKMLADEEALPFGGEKIDLVMSNLCLHWINDVPGTLIQIRRALKPDGLFLASMLGGDTLIELRQAFTIAELERAGGLSAHVSPLAGVTDGGNLLSRAGFTMPAVDTDTLTFYFPSAISLMQCLQGMGESNAVTTRLSRASPDLIIAAAAVYEALYGTENGIPATFQVLYLTGWAPSETQQRPKERGSAQLDLADLGTVLTALEDAPPGGPPTGLPGGGGGGGGSPAPAPGCGGGLK